MKKNILYAALACMAILFTGCNEDDFGNGNVQAVEKHMGDDIKFGGSASYDVPSKKKSATRTVYGGYESGADAEPVYWVTGDQVRLYCPEALVQTADYQVSTADGTSATTGLDKMTAAGLQWANPEKPHTFYGVYPIPADDVLKTNQVLTGIIPDVQGYESCNVDNNGNYVFAPDMKNAYMVAKTYVEKPNKIGDDVFLKFAPIATALEIEIKNSSGNDLVLREVHFSSATRALSGEFTANLDNMTLGGKDSDNVRYASGCPSGIQLADNATKAVGVRLLVNGSAITLAKDKTLKFTVFMLPSTDGANADAVNDLKMTLIGDDGGKKTGTFTGVNIIMSKKNYIHALPLGTGAFTYNQAEWLKYVEDSKVMSALSIPGAGGASSGNIFGKNGEDNVDDYLEQSLSIEDLWNTGIRCFEFTVDCYDSYTIDANGNVTSYTNDGTIGNNNVYCNAQNTGLTLTTCVDRVKTLLGQHPEEFAMVIVTYQQQCGWNQRQSNGTVNQIRDPKQFMSQFNTFWTNLEMPTGTRKALYNHGATVKDARGSLFCIARPTSNGEDNYAVITTESWKPGYVSTVTRIKSTTYAHTIETPVVTDPNILVIHGWGALKDKWYARGFTDCIYHRGSGWTAFTNALKDEECRTAMGYNPGRPGRPFDTSSKSTDAFTTLSTGDYYENVHATTGKTSDLGLESNFYYSTVCSEHETPQANAAWVQEWARVSKETKTYTITQNSKYVKWIESKTEKELDVLECLEKALDDKEGQVIYINSLCGYYITDNVPKSIYPNSLTDYNISYNNITWTDYYYIKPATLSTMSSDAGMCGDIANFASDMNSYFLQKLQAKLNLDNRLGGSTGIVLMDRVSKDGDAAKIPSIIIANNFAPDVNSSDSNVDIPGTDEEDGDDWASKGYRDISWGEWEN